MKVYAHVQVPGYPTQHIDLHAGEGVTAEDALGAVLDTFGKSTFVRLGNAIFRADQIAFLSVTDSEDQA